MSVFRGSRYQNLKATGLVQNDGTVRPLLHMRDPLTLNALEGRYKQHVVQGRQELDLLAYQYGDKSTLWWVIADINDVLFALTLTEGQQLAIPIKRFFGKF
jgi:hypothetical protein